MALVITRDVSAYTKALCVKLQGWCIDIVSAYNQISFVKTTLQNVRDDVDTVHAHIYETPVEVAVKVGVDECEELQAGNSTVLMCLIQINLKNIKEYLQSQPLII